MSRHYKLLGALEIEDDGRPSPVMKYGKGCALLAYLIVTGQPQRREIVADLLWEASSTAQAFRNLRALLHKLRPVAPELAATDLLVSFQIDRDIAVDYLQVAVALAGDDIAALDEALALYRGDLLENFLLENAPAFGEWLLLERERFRQQVWKGFRRVCAAYQEEKAWGKGIAAAERWLALDELDETVHRQLMRFLAADGQVEAALAQYERCREALRETLGVEPEAATTAVAAELKQLIIPATGQLAEPGPLPPNSFLPYHRNMTFTGRANYLQRLAELLLPEKRTQAGRFNAAVITGMGGLGKSQLAVEYAYRYGRFYPGGVYWMSFAEAEYVAEEVAATGGERGMKLYRLDERLPLSEQVKRVQTAWQEPVPRLLIFDNCEDDLLAADWLPVLGGCRVILTGRRGDWPLEMPLVEMPLAVMSLDEAVSFLAQIAKRLSPEEAADVAAEVGNLPLALQLAGHYLARHKRVSVAEYLGQLRSGALLGHDSLQGKYSRYSPTGHELHVARTFALSYDRLDTADAVDGMARRLLGNAAHFAPGEPVPENLLLATVLDGEVAEEKAVLAGTALFRLISLGFLTQDGSENVVMHRLLAAFTRDVVGEDEAGQTAVAGAQVGPLLPILEHTKFQGSLPYATSHLRHSIEAISTKLPRQAALMALTLGRHLREEGEFEPARLYLEKGAEAAESVSDYYTHGRILVALAHVYESQGLIQKSLEAARQAEQLLRMSGTSNPEWLIHCLYRQGWENLRLGQAGPALEAGKVCLQLSREADNKNMIATSLVLLGSIRFFLLGEYEPADRDFEEAAARYRALGDLYAVMAALANLGNSAIAQGDYERAASFFEEAITIAQETGSHLREQSFLINMGEIQVATGQYAATIANLAPLKDEVPENWRLGADLLHVLAEAYLGLGQLEEALAAAQDSAAKARGMEIPYSIGHAWRVLGRIAAELNRPIAALPDREDRFSAVDCFKTAAETFANTSQEREQAIVLWNWSDYEIEKGDTAEGRRLWRQAHDIFTRLNLPLMIGRMEQTRLW